MLSVMGDKGRSLTMPHSVEGDIILGQLLEHCKLIHWLGWGLGDRGGNREILLAVRTRK